MILTYTEITDDDFGFIKEIYDHYILHSTSTYYTEEIPVQELKEFIPVNHEKYSSFVIRADGISCGFCYISQYKKRQAYDRTAEVSLYLTPGFTGRGIGPDALRPLAKGAGDSMAFILPVDSNQFTMNT